MKTHTNVRWFPFEHRQDWGFKGERVSSCYLGKVFKFTEWRNAGRRDYGDHSLCLDLAGAKRKIDEHRKRGSNWVVEELPVMVLAGNRDSLVVGESDARPLADLVRSRARYTTLAGAAEHCQPSFLFRGFRMVARRGLVPPAELPFWEHRTDGSLGGRLVWNWTSNIDTASVQRLISRTNSWLQRHPVLW